MSEIPVFRFGTIQDYLIRGAITTQRMRAIDPGVNQPAQETVDGLGSADYLDPHGNV